MSSILCNYALSVCVCVYVCVCVCVCVNDTTWNDVVDIMQLLHDIMQLFTISFPSHLQIHCVPSFSISGLSSHSDLQCPPDPLHHFCWISDAKLSKVISHMCLLIARRYKYAWIQRYNKVLCYLGDILYQEGTRSQRAHSRNWPLNIFALCIGSGGLWCEILQYLMLIKWDITDLRYYWLFAGGNRDFWVIAQQND